MSVTASAGRTRSRAEERLGHYAGGIFGGIVGGGGGGFGGAGIGITMGATVAALVALTSVVAGAYTLARTLFTHTVRTRATKLEGLVAILAAQITALAAQDMPPRALR